MMIQSPRFTQLRCVRATSRKRRRGPSVLARGDERDVPEFNRCWDFLRSLPHLKTSLFNSRYDALYEDDGEDDALDHEGGDYLPPKGWCKFALRVDDLRESWGISFHGTKAGSLADIVECGKLRAPGARTAGGATVRRRSGHTRWDKPYIFTSRTPRYASLYATPCQYRGRYYQVMLMLRQDRSRAYEIENTLSKMWDTPLRLDRNVSNAKIGFYTRHSSSLQLYAVLAKEHKYHPHDDDDGELARHRRKRELEEGRAGDPVVLSDSD